MRLFVSFVSSVDASPFSSASVLVDLVSKNGNFAVAKPPGLVGFYIYDLGVSSWCCGDVWRVGCFGHLLKLVKI